MRRLFPHPEADISVADACAGDRPRHPNRPWVSLCMVSSIDGSTSVAENSRALSNPVDQQVLLTLRSLADVVLVGARTVRADGYGPPRADGPLFVVVSRSADFTFEERFWQSDRVMLLLPADGPSVPVRSLRVGHGTPDLARAVASFDAATVLAEGGPTVNGLLTAADLVDEVNVTWSPRLAGGDGGRLTRGAPEAVRSLRLDHLYEDDGFLFARYLRPS
ncbi:MAG: hypothetical protein RJB61_1161 [Actinomycetota bacterium]